jgi:hypothetical protein
MPGLRQGEVIGFFVYVHPVSHLLVEADPESQRGMPSAWWYIGRCGWHPTICDSRGLLRQRDPEGFFVRHRNRAAEVNHLPLAVLVSLHDAEPERCFLVTNPEPDHPIDGPPHSPLLLGERVSRNDRDSRLALSGQRPPQSREVSPPFVRVGPEKRHIGLARDVTLQEVHVSIASGLRNATSEVL